MMAWFQLHPLANTDHLGFIPQFITPEDERPAAEQIAEHYIGGWNPQKGFTLAPGARAESLRSLALLFPGDPPMLPLWATVLRDELVVVYDYGYTAIFDKELNFAASRLD